MALFGMGLVGRGTGGGLWRVARWNIICIISGWGVEEGLAAATRWTNHDLNGKSGRVGGWAYG